MGGGGKLWNWMSTWLDVWVQMFLGQKARRKRARKPELWDIGPKAHEASPITEHFPGQYSCLQDSGPKFVDLFESYQEEC